MVKFLIARPIAVFMFFIVSMILGLFLLGKIPVSLLPDIDVPQIVIKINAPNTNAKVIEDNMVQKVRDALMGLDNIKNIETESGNHSAVLYLTFDYGSKMDLAFIEVNEKLDQVTPLLPRNLSRPQVMRVSTSDIPVVRLQVIPKVASNYAQVSTLTEKVIKKRLEQIEGVSMVDINGLQGITVSISPNAQALQAAGLSEDDLAAAIQRSNIDQPPISVRDGQYRFFIKLSNRLAGTAEIAAIPVFLKDGTVSQLGKFCTVNEEVSQRQGYHLYNGRTGMVITIQKQPGSRMNDLRPNITKAVSVFAKDYPGVDFALTQDQTFLLDQGIQNLTQDLWYGGFFCVLLLFLFLGNISSPILMSISIPVSLLLTFTFFYFFNISFNIISLSGLALGIGMLIDNSIVVLDNITRKKRDGFSVDDSCIIGVNEVISPVLSNVLTTVAIYLPLTYMSGLAGALVHDQAIALTISLGVSLLVAFGLNPVMYKYFLRVDSGKLKEDTIIYKFILKGYHKMISHIFDHKAKYFLFTLLVMPIGFILFKFVPVATLPKLTETETMIDIDWNEPVDAQENFSRVERLGKVIQKNAVCWEAEAGMTQFSLQQGFNSIQLAHIYYDAATTANKMYIDKIVAKWLFEQYPIAKCNIRAASNAFTQLFSVNEPFLEARFRPSRVMSESEINSGMSKLMTKISHPFTLGPGFAQEPDFEMELSRERLLLYGVDQMQLENTLERLFGSSSISELKRFGDRQIIRFSQTDGNISQKLTSLIAGSNGQYYPLETFLVTTRGSVNKYIQADLSGQFQSIQFADSTVHNMQSLQDNLRNLAHENGFSVNFTGAFQENSKLMEEMIVIFLISLLLLYFILAVQFENLLHPFLVMLTIPLGIGGAMLLLWIAGGTLNIMTAIGFVVVLGIIVDDPSLKVETINRLRAEYQIAGDGDKRAVLIRALHQAGEICLKPLLMVSLTTSLALIPVLFSGGIGNELQRPMVYVIVGGLTIGTFFTLWFIPLAYWFITRKDS